MTAMITPTVLTPDAIAARVEQSLGAIAGVSHRVLWYNGESSAGRMTIEGGHHLGEHQHRRHDHHMWVLDGQVEILGSLLGLGSYVHIPPGVLHDLDARETQGCTIFYLYLA